MKILSQNKSPSYKVTQVKENEFGEMVWWFPASSEQFRLQGKYSIISSEISDSWWQNERIETWKKLSPPAKSQFFWPEPGVEYSGLEEETANENEENSESHSSPPENFLLLLLIPDSVHYLRLKDNYAAQETFVNGQWKQRRVNP